MSRVCNSCANSLKTRYRYPQKRRLGKILVRAILIDKKANSSYDRNNNANDDDDDDDDVLFKFCGTFETKHFDAVEDRMRFDDDLMKRKLRKVSFALKTNESVLIGREREKNSMMNVFGGNKSKETFVELLVPTVSMKHCKISRDFKGDLYVMDLKSKNGTTVNGEMLASNKRVKVEIGDLIVFGDEYCAKFEVKQQQKRANANGNTINFGNIDLSTLGKALDISGSTLKVIGTGAKKLFDDAQEMRVEQQKRERQMQNAAEASQNARNVEAALMPIYDDEEDAFSNNDNNNEKTIMRVILGPIGEWASGPVVDLDIDESLILGSGKKKGDCDVIVPNVDGKIESRHCVVKRDRAGVFVKDLGSKFGTWIDENRCEENLEYQLAPRQIITLGERAEFQFSALKANEEYIAPIPKRKLNLVEAEVLQPVPRIDASKAKMIISNANLRRDEIVSTGDDDDAPTAWSAISGALAKRDNNVDLAQNNESGGIKGLGDAIGAAIFNSKININYQYKPTVNVGNAGKTGPAELKSALFVELADTQRGLKADKGKRRKIEQILRALEAKNPTRSPLKSPLMNGRWALQYTTELDAVGKNKPGFMRPQGAIYQTVDIFSQTVLNEETYSPLPFVSFKSRNISELDAQTESRAKVKKQEYSFAGMKMKAPPKTPGRQIADWEMEASGLGSMAWMDTTFVDADLRISRTQSGEVFVFSRNDPNDDDDDDDR